MLKSLAILAVFLFVTSAGKLGHYLWKRVVVKIEIRRLKAGSDSA
jgi:hypothetical protein